MPTLPKRKATKSRLLGAVACLLAAQTLGCDDRAEDHSAPAASSSTGAISPELARKVLVKVGPTALTVGEYVAALERMDEFERLRYQGPDRRKKLLEEMINLELLAAEARRRGLDKRPETRQHLRQMLRDAMLEEARRTVPKPEDVPEEEVRFYFEAHKAEFAEPERRRVAHIALGTRADAERVLKLAMVASPEEWGRLVKAHSRDAPKTPQENTALELLGDLGIVGPVGHPAGGNPRVPEPLRQAVFEIGEVGKVHASYIELDGQFHIVRMTSRTDPRQRTFVEAERTARVAVTQRLILEAEARFETELRKRFPVQIDEKALEQVRVPTFADGPAPAPSH